MVDRYIIELLQQEGKAVVPNLGTFFTTQKTAQIDTDDSVLIPPVEIIAFTNTAFESQKDDLRDFIFSKGDKLASQIEVELEQYAQSVKEQLAEEGELFIQGLGKLEQKEEEIVFHYNENFAMNYESFGLPKIEARPVRLTASYENEEYVDGENDSNSNSGERTAKASVAWIIIATLVLLAAVVLYFFFNPQAYENVKAMISDAKQQVETPISKEESNAETPTKEENSSETEVAKEESTVADTDTASAQQEKETPKASESKQKDEAPSTSTNKFVTKPTNRFYLIAGSFNNKQSAEQALEKALSKGYSEAKIVQSDNRFRMSIGDYATRTEAIQAIAEADKKDYKGVWQLKY